MWVKVTKSWVHSVSKPLHLENPPLQDLRWHRKQSLRPQGEGGCDPWRTPCFSQRSGSWVLFPKNRFFTGKRKNKTNKGKDLKYNWLQDGVMYFFLVGGGVVCVFIFVNVFLLGDLEPWSDADLNWILMGVKVGSLKMIYPMVKVHGTVPKT